jgi:hypothetical protein
MCRRPHRHHVIVGPGENRSEHRLLRKDGKCVADTGTTKQQQIELKVTRSALGQKADIAALTELIGLVPLADLLQAVRMTFSSGPDRRQRAGTKP